MNHIKSIHLLGFNRFEVDHGSRRMYTRQPVSVACIECSIHHSNLRPSPVQFAYKQSRGAVEPGTEETWCALAVLSAEAIGTSIATMRPPSQRVRNTPVKERDIRRCKVTLLFGRIP